MPDKKGGKKKSSVPPSPAPARVVEPREGARDPQAELKMQRDAFVHTFFKRGAEFTEELLRENERLRKQAIDFEAENAKLRTQLASDEAIRDLLRKIEMLEREKRDLLSHVHEAEAVSTRFSSRYEEMEQELSNLANLYVASYQLHSTLRLPLVMKHLRELLAQLVGARAHAYYVANPARTELVPVASDGIRGPIARIVIAGSAETVNGATPALQRVVESVFLTGRPHIREAEDAPAEGEPAACVPMRIDDEVVGVIVVFSLLEQKPHFADVDYEFFKMLGAHAGTALMGALLFDSAEGKLPDLEAIQKRGGVASEKTDGDR